MHISDTRQFQRRKYLEDNIFLNLNYYVHITCLYEIIYVWYLYGTHICICTYMDIGRYTATYTVIIYICIKI
jgi:hypothetical protein